MKLHVLQMATSLKWQSHETSRLANGD